MYLNSEVIKQLNAFLEEHKDVSFTSAQLYSNFFEPLIGHFFLPCNATSVTQALTEPRNCGRLYIKAEKIKNRYHFQYEKKVSTITGYKKIKNRLYFENEENIPFYYDFSTQKTNITAQETRYLTFANSTTRIVYKYATQYTTEPFYSIKEWIFSYPELWEKTFPTDTLCIQFDCPAGYINFLKSNNLYINKKSYDLFKLYSFFPNNKLILAKNWMPVINVLDEVKKQYLFTHPILFSLIQKIVMTSAKNFELSSRPADSISQIIYYCMVLKAEENNFSILNSNRGLAYNEKSLAETYENRADEVLATNLQKINGINHYQVADYEIIVPQSIKDLNSESRQQNNCVNYYYNNSIRLGRNYIYFLRKKVNLDKSYMTCRFNVQNKATIEYFYKNNRKLIKSEKIRHEQSKELSNKDEELKYYKNAFSKVTRALDIITKRRPMPYIHNYVSFAESVMAGKRAREMDEEAQREFDEANKKGEDIWP